MAKRIYTKGGDSGETGLLYGGRVGKDDPRTEAYGALDEAVSALGLARALSEDARVRAELLALQRQLFTVGAELATAAEDHAKLVAHFSAVTAQMTSGLEAAIDALSGEVSLGREFIVPGGSPASAALDLGRATLRRAERRAVALAKAGMLANPEVLAFLNRASDYLFMLARYQDRGLPPEPVTPHPARKEHAS
ncbi:MAG: cob(I)yrinic acid a,c-diamide adenosyltransferase [Chloroflexota bacterium]